MSANNGTVKTNAPAANAPAANASANNNNNKGFLSKISTSLFGNKNKPANATKKANAKPSASNVAALNASLAGTATAAPSPTAAPATRRRTRKQRGGARGLPGVRNVLRVTGKTARKLGRVGTYGLKKVGNGVHVVTGLLRGIFLKKRRN